MKEYILQGVLYYEEIGNTRLKVGQPHVPQDILKQQQKHRDFESSPHSWRHSVNSAFCKFMSLHCASSLEINEV